MIATKLISSILQKLNITILRGNVRKDVLQMEAAILPEELMANAKLLPRREDALKYITKGGVAVEVGVAYGGFSDEILKTLQPDKFIAIDAFGRLPIVTNTGNVELTDIHRSEHYNFYANKYAGQIEKGTLQMMRGYSWDQIAELPDRSVDYFYIDADHAYGSVKKDIEALRSKLKPSGIIQFNDYTCFDVYALKPYGVSKAVNEFLISDDFEILYLCLEKHDFFDVVIRKRNN